MYAVICHTVGNEYGRLPITSSAIPLPLLCFINFPFNPERDEIDAYNTDEVKDR
jgi:hypothetical protein